MLILMSKKLPVVFLIVSFILGFTFPNLVFAARSNFKFFNRTISTTPTPKLIVKPISSPSPLISPSSSPSPSPKSSATAKPKIDVVKTFLLGEINKYRLDQGLTAVQTNYLTCDFAKVRAWEISQKFNHDGFRARKNSNSLPYPSYSIISENIAQNSDYTKVVASWIASAGHAQNLRRATSFVCVERVGDFYTYEGWKP